MILTSKKYLSYALAFFAFVLAILFFVKQHQLQNEIEKLKHQQVSATKKSSSYKNLKTYDSLISNEDYELASKHYDLVLSKNKNELSKHLNIQNDLLKNFMKLRTSFLSLQKKQKDSILVTATKKENLIKPDEIRMYDSIAFELEKANLQLENIKNQYKKKSFGQYLTFKSSKGSTIHYVGEVTAGKANGYGVALLNSGSRYQGEWKDNLRHGQGSFYWSDGHRYEGDFYNDRRTGKGTYYWLNGNKYIGEWLEDLRNGEGTLYDKDEKIIAQGIWELDKLVKQD